MLVTFRLAYHLRAESIISTNLTLRASRFCTRCLTEAVCTDTVIETVCAAATTVSIFYACTVFAILIAWAVCWIITLTRDGTETVIATDLTVHAACLQARVLTDTVAADSIAQTFA